MDKFSVQNAEKIGECIGKVIDVDDIMGPMGLDRDFLRVKVEVNTQKPILAGIWYTRTNGERGRAEIRYERLSDFCFGCERIGHGDRGCKIEIVMGDTEEEGPMYGSWIRVERPRKKGQSCRIIGKMGKEGENEVRRKTWHEPMKEKEERDKNRSRGQGTSDKTSRESTMGEGMEHTNQERGEKESNQDKLDEDHTKVEREEKTQEIQGLESGAVGQ